MKSIIFVDYWNLVLSLQQVHGAQVNIDWYGLGPRLTQIANTVINDLSLHLQYQEMRVYSSIGENDEKLKQWLVKMRSKPGIRVFIQERKPKRPASCPSCKAPLNSCPSCGCVLRGTQEKGVDTLIVTDLLSLGLDGAYDAALLVSQDFDMAPAVEHLANKGIKVIHAGIRHYGRALAEKCWASFDLYPLREQLFRDSPGK